jgi:hypothetical protein
MKTPGLEHGILMGMSLGTMGTWYQHGKKNTMIPPIEVYGKAWAVNLTGHNNLNSKTPSQDTERALAKRTKLRTSPITGQHLKLSLTGSRISRLDACTSLITRQHLKQSFTGSRISHLDACTFSQTCQYTSWYIHKILNTRDVTYQSGQVWSMQDFMPKSYTNP